MADACAAAGRPVRSVTLLAVSKRFGPDAVRSLHVDSAHVLHARMGPLIRPPAGDLVRAAMLHARNEGLRVDPQCSYADAWMRRHPEFDALRA